MRLRERASRCLAAIFNRLYFRMGQGNWRDHASERRGIPPDEQPKNARLLFEGGKLLVDCIAGMEQMPAASTSTVGICSRTASKWLKRFWSAACRACRIAARAR